jgi:hypothetical protein
MDKFFKIICLSALIYCVACNPAVIRYRGIVDNKVHVPEVIKNEPVKIGRGYATIKVNYNEQYFLNLSLLNNTQHFTEVSERCYNLCRVGDLVDVYSDKGCIVWGKSEEHK